MPADAAIAAPQLRIAQRSLRGLREENQDATGARVPAGIARMRKGIALAIADGVSAAEAGRIAAETSVQNFLADYYATPDEWSARRSGGQVLNALNRWLLGQGLQVRDTRRGHVTTFTGCIFLGRQLHLFHIGDTRLYRLREGELERLSRDHRVLLDDHRPVLSRALGLDHSVDIDYRNESLQAGDVYLLVTDGIHDFLGDEALHRVLLEHDDPEAACEALVSEALATGSDDNLSCVVGFLDAVPDQDAGDIADTWDHLPIPPLLSPGQILDGLRVDKLLAESARSQVYRVHEIATGRDWVMKTPSPRCEDPTAVRREYAIETWILRRIHHPRLPKAGEPQQARSALYVLTAPVAGQSLRAWMKKFPQAPVPEAINVVRQVAIALRALHRRDVLHRDVRPENVLVDQNGQATLIDLGQCRVASLFNQQADGTIGALEYAAPEHRLNPRAVGDAADQFSLAAMLYEMLSGRLPFDGKLAEMHVRGRFMQPEWIPASRYNPLVPSWLDEVLRRALDMEPVLRYGDITEFADALLKPAAATSNRKQALMERNPLRFWQGLALLLLISQLVSLAFLLRA